MYSIFLFGIFFQLLSLTVGNKFLLENTAPTNWGFWAKEFSECPNDTFVSAFQLKVQGRQWSGDDTALNAIKLFCSSLDNPEDYLTNIISSEGAYGSWGTVFQCKNGLFTGLELNSEGDKGYHTDDTAANNLRMTCSNSYYGAMTGDGMNWGYWGTPNKCLTKQAICGLKTQVGLRSFMVLDDIGLNNVHMECCDIKDPAEICTPTDSWRKISECDNIEGTYPMICKFDKTTGVGVSTDKKNYFETIQSLGFEINELGSTLSKTFRTKMKMSPRTDLDWEQELPATWKEMATFPTKFSVPPGKIARVFQVVGTCGNFNVFANKYKKEETDTPFKK